MATINELSIWEPNIYELEITDPVIGGPTGISNRAHQQQTNRTRKIYDVLEQHGVYIEPGNHEFIGQNLDITATFEGTVADGDLVYYNETNTQYEKAIADGTEKAAFVGVADVTNGKVIAGGFLGNPVITGVPAQGDIIFLSNTVAGQMTTASSAVPVGKWLWTGSPSVMSLNSGVGGGGLGTFDHEQDTYRMLLNDSWFEAATWDNLTDVALLLDPGYTMTHDFGENKFTFTAGQFFETINLYDPTLSITVDRAFLSVDIDDSGSTIFEMTANGGANWEPVANNSVHTFANTGNDLRIRITGGGTGEVRSYAVLYNPNVNLWNNLAAILHSAITNDEPEAHNDIGQIIPVIHSNTPPANYLECDGALISKTTYAALYSGYPLSIGNRFGESGGSFYLPDFRGRFPRGRSGTSGRDPDAASRYADSGGITGNNVGSMQNDGPSGLGSHNHKWFNYNSSGHDYSYNSSGGIRYLARNADYGPVDAKLVTAASNDLNGTLDFWTANAGGGAGEVRPENFYVMWCIRYQ